MGTGEHRVVVDGASIWTPRLRLRPWSTADDHAALAIFGSAEVAKWLAPAMSRVQDRAAMHALIDGWLAEAADLEPPQGRWAIELRDARTVVGAVTLLAMPPHGVDLEIGWQLAPVAWGSGLAAEAGHAVAHHAFASGIDELFAVVRPRNKRGVATARRVGMEWVGETDKYYDLHLQVYRLRKGELDVPGPDSARRPAR